MKIIDQERFLNPIRDAGIPKDKLIVVGGAALALFGIKGGEFDIDVVVTPDQFISILGNGLSNPDIRRRSSFIDGRNARFVEHGLGSVISEVSYGITRGDLTYMLPPNDSLYQATFEELQSEAVDIDGVLASPPSRILDWKLALDRPKDQQDISLIREYLAQNIKNT